MGSYIHVENYDKLGIINTKLETQTEINLEITCLYNSHYFQITECILSLETFLLTKK